MSDKTKLGNQLMYSVEYDKSDLPARKLFQDIRAPIESSHEAETDYDIAGQYFFAGVHVSVQKSRQFKKSTK